MRVTKSIVRAVTVLLALAVCSSEAAERPYKKVTVEPGGEVLVYGHKNWDKGCRPLPAPSIKITRPPANGTVALRPGTFLIDGSWHPEAERSCLGKSVSGLGVYYRANATFRGVDPFEYDVTLGTQRKIIFGVEAQVNVK
jgi:hypothetical protein